MIVSDNNVQTALEYLAIDPHPMALARKDVVDAENKAKQVYCRAFLAADGSVAAKDATATIDAEHVSAKADEAQAILELERHKARTKAAEMLLAIFQTESANARAAERVR